MRFVHAADIHLDSPLIGLQRYDGAPVDEIRAATRLALGNLVELCVSEGAQLLVIAGDLYDGDWRDYSTGLFFAAQMSRLRDEGVQVVWIRGNHDAASQITRHLRLPENVRELSPLHPETLVLEQLGVAVHGQGFAKRAVKDDLSLGYPDPVPGLFNLGLLHTCLTGRAGHDPYAPCALDTLVHKGYDYWALGHVHQREVLHREPWVVFSGNLQGRHAKETGDKGASVVGVQDGRVHQVCHTALDVVRFCRAEVVLDGLRNPDDMLDQAQKALGQSLAEADGRTLVARVVLRGRTALHARLRADPEHWENELRVLATDLEGYAWLEGMQIATQPEQAEGVARGGDLLGRLRAALHALQREPHAVGELLPELSALRSKLPTEARTGPGGLRLDSPEELARMLEDVEHMLHSRLLPGEDGA